MIGRRGIGKSGLKPVEETKRKQSLSEFYNEKLVHEIEALEDQRKELLEESKAASIKIAAIGGGILALGTALLSMGLSLHPIPLLMTLGGAAAAGYGIYRNKVANIRQPYVDNFKRNVIFKIAQHVHEDLQYIPYGNIGIADFQKSGLFRRRIDRYKSEDLFKGQIDKTAITFSEVHAENRKVTKDSKGRRQVHWVTIFDGVLFIADFNKSFQNKTVVLPDYTEKISGTLLDSLKSFFDGQGKLVKLENPEFENLFKVYSEDLIEARYILSTSLQERIVKLTETFGTHIYISFVDEKIHIGIPIEKNLFEPRALRRPSLDKELVSEYAEILSSFISIVEDLNLNTRIWTKK